MPTESLPWDRKEAFLKDRKQEKSVGSDAVGGGGGAGGGSCSTSRWREPYHGLRDCPRTSPRRPLTGHYRYDAGFHPLYPEESSWHGCTPSRSGDRFCPEEESFRLSSGRSGGGGGKSSSNGGREGWCSSRRSPCLESSGDCARQHHFSPVTAQRSVAVPISYTSSSSSSPIPLRNFVDKNDGGVIDGLGTCPRYDRDHSLGSIAWKPLKWTRPSSLSMSKTVRPDSEENNLEISVPQVIQSPLSSPVMSSFPSEDRASSKKPRLGWGQGLAKYEKQKVEGAVDFSGQNGSVQSTNSGKDFCRDSSPKLSALHGSTSPATPTSANCSSSPACTDEKLSIKVSTSETDRTQSCDSSAPRVHNSPERISINLDELDANSVSTLDLLLNDLMQPEEACSGDSSFTRHSTLNKLLLLKKDISKELEKTECDIDLFENKLKSINCDTQKNNYQECTYTTQGVGVAQPSLNSIDTSSKMFFSDNCMPASSACLEGQQVVLTHLSEELANEAKDCNHNSSGTIICDVQLACSDRENINSSNLQSDMFPVNIMDEKTKFLDARHLVHPAMHLPAVVCGGELSCSLDLIMNNAVDSSAALILASNKDAAKRASQEFDMAMPSGISQFNLWETDNILQCRKNYMYIRGKLAINKRILKFKERALTLKFRALHHLWREDLNLLIMRKNRPKSNKRSEANIRLPQLALQKHRSSTRSRYALLGNLTLVPTTEILNFTSKLLSDSQLRLYRNNLKMPAQIIDESERKYSRFSSYNGLIEDPSALEKERLMMNPWVQDEKNIFLEMLATFGKDFKKISSFIPCKTTADCVEFYYKNHKLESFTEVKRQLKLKKQWQSRHSNTYLITSGSRFNREANAASLELLGSAIIASESNCSKRNNQKQSGKVSRRSNGFLKEANSEISGSEKEAAAADVLAGICGTLSSDAMSSCVTSSIDLPDRIHFTMIDCSLTPEAAPQTIDEEDTCSGESSDEMESADWTDEEKSMFIRAFNMYGRDFVKVANFVGTRSRDQCKIFFSKARKCLGLDVIQHGSTNGVTPTSDANEGRSGTDDACSTQSCSKMDADFTQSVLKTWNEGHVNTDNASQQTDADKLCVQCEIDGSIPIEVDSKYDIKSSLNEDKLIIKGGDVHGAVESFVVAQTNNENTGNMSSLVKPVVEPNSEDKLKSQISVKAPLKADEMYSNHLVLLPSPVVDNLPQVKMEDSGALGGSFFFGQSLHSNGNCCDVVEQKKKGYPSNVFPSTFKHQVPLELLCSLPKGQHTKAEKPEPAVSDGPNCVLPNISSVFFDKANTEPSISILNMQVGGKCELESISRDLLAQDLFKTPFPNLIDSPIRIAAGGSEILSQNHKKLQIDKKLIDGKSALEIPALDNRTSQTNCSLVPELKNDSCAGACVLNSRQDYESERYLMEDKSVAHQTTQSQFDSYAESEEQSHQVGDLKLFGQILSHPSFLKSSSQEGTKANATTNSSTVWKDAAIFAPMPGSNNALTHHLGEIPQRSYGFWDGNRIQTGFSSLPESAIKLAKYQVSSTGMPFRNNTNSDYQQQAQMQSVSTEMKFLETFPPELQKRNGFDLLAGFQQQQRMVHLGVNMVSAGVSDPVAALQMHYSGRRAKILTSDLESLTGDMGGR